MTIYERNINTAVKEKSDKTFLTKASLLDLNHSIRVELEIDVESKTITEADALIVKAPFDICEKTIELMDRVVGLKIERGISKKLSKRLGSSSGCTHLFELTLEAVRLSSNIMLGFASVGSEEWIDRDQSDEEFIEEAMPYLKNACLPFKEEDDEDQPED